MLNHPRAYLGEHRMLTKTRFGQLIFVDTRDVSISPHIIMSGDWEPWVTNALERMFWAGETFIDVGANCGWYSLLAASRGMKVMAFEPNPSLCTLMSQTAAVNGLVPLWQILDCPLSSVSGEEVTLALDPHNQGGAHLVDGKGPQGTQVTSCLDDQLPPGTKVDVIKIDVEGYEHKVLLGGQRVMSENNELMLAVEHHAGDRKMIEWLQGLGFELGRFAHEGKIVGCSVDEACDLADAEMLCFSRT